MTKAELVYDAKATLGEGPSWDAASGLLYWVDIAGGRIHRWSPSDGTDTYAEIGQMVGAAVPDTSGGLTLAAQHGFYRYDLLTRKLAPLGDPEEGLPNNRFNDGKCDSRGRFWAGTMDMIGDSPSGALYRLDGDGRTAKMLTGISCSNGIAWSPDDRIMYYIDSPTRRVVAYEFDAESGNLGSGRTVIELAKDEGVPDGMTSDAEGNLWVAQWGGSCVSRWNPVTGKRLSKVELPAAKVTSCVFGGPRLDELYITTARIGLSEEELREQPLAGGLFRYKAGVQGMPTYSYKVETEGQFNDD